jgi:hypothetical protein
MRLSWKQAVTALKYPNYRLWFWGQIISLFGMWMESTALGFLVFELTRSPAYLGLVGFVTGVPTWMFMLYAGVIADRIPARRSSWSPGRDGLAFAVAADLPRLVQPGTSCPGALLGAANAFEAPSRQSFVLGVVPAGHDQHDRPEPAMFNRRWPSGRWPEG